MWVRATSKSFWTRCACSLSSREGRSEQRKDTEEQQSAQNPNTTVLYMQCFRSRSVHMRDPFRQTISAESNRVHRRWLYSWTSLLVLINTSAENRASWCSVRPRAHMPRAKSNTAEMKSPQAARIGGDSSVSVCHTAQYAAHILDVIQCWSTNMATWHLPRDLKTWGPANFPSKNTVLFSVLKYRLILTSSTSMEPAGGGADGERHLVWVWWFMERLIQPNNDDVIFCIKRAKAGVSRSVYQLVQANG